MVEPQFLIVCLKCFLHFGYQKCSSFHNLPNIHFFKHVLQISHNLRIIKVHNNVSGEKTLSQNCFKQGEVDIYVDKTIGQLTKVRTPRRQNWAAELRKLAAANITLHLVLTKMSELTLTIKTCSHKQIWAACDILRSRSSPNFLKLTPSPTTVQNFFNC